MLHPDTERSEGERVGYQGNRMPSNRKRDAQARDLRRVYSVGNEAARKSGGISGDRCLCLYRCRCLVAVAVCQKRRLLSGGDRPS